MKRLAIISLVTGTKLPNGVMLSSVQPIMIRSVDENTNAGVSDMIMPIARDMIEKTPSTIDLNTLFLKGPLDIENKDSNMDVEDIYAVQYTRPEKPEGANTFTLFDVRVLREEVCDELLQD